MTRDDIERWTREAGGFAATPEFLERFAALVAAAERKSKNKMTKDDIIRMAKKTGYPIGHPEWLKATEEFAAVVAAHEREACARVCEADGLLWGQRYAATIRARGEK